MIGDFSRCYIPMIGVGGHPERLPWAKRSSDVGAALTGKRNGKEGVLDPRTEDLVPTAFVLFPPSNGEWNGVRAGTAVEPSAGVRKTGVENGIFGVPGIPGPGVGRVSKILGTLHSHFGSELFWAARFFE